MFLVDKHRPKKYEDFAFHKKTLDTLNKMAKDDSIPNTIFYGNEGSGKKTIIRYFLNQIYDDTTDNLEEAIFTINGSGNTQNKVKIFQSDYHIVIEPGNTNFDRYIVQDVVKRYAMKKAFEFNKRKFKIVLINNADCLSTTAQTSLRRTMEEFTDNCRFIICCRALSKIILPLISRCCCFRIESPTNFEMFELLLDISYKEKINLNHHDYNKIMDKAAGNIKIALWLLNYSKYNSDTFVSVCDPPPILTYQNIIEHDDNISLKDVNSSSNKINENLCETPYDVIILEITNLLKDNVKASNPDDDFIYDSNKIKNNEYNSSNTLIKIRQLLQKIMIGNINSTKIITDITNLLINDSLISFKNKLKISHYASKFEYELVRGRRLIIHLEAFIIRVYFSINSINGD